MAQYQLVRIAPLAYILRMKIVRTHRYMKDLKRIGATLAEADSIDALVAANPEAGDVIKGLRGIRKIRFALGGRGKSGDGRAIYFLRLTDDVAILLTAYAKNEQTDLTPVQRKALLAVLEELNDD